MAHRRGADFLKKSDWGAAPDPEVFLNQRRIGLVFSAILPEEHRYDVCGRYPTRHLILLNRPGLWAFRHLLSEFSILSVDLARAAWHGLGFLE
jgi:hypothetical protein